MHTMALYYMKVRHLLFNYDYLIKSLLWKGFHDLEIYIYMKVIGICDFILA